MNIKPVRDWLLVEPDEFKGPAGLILLDSTKDPGGVNSGHVVAQGPGHIEPDGMYTDFSAGVGDHILFMRKHGILVKHEGRNLLMVRDENVMAVFEDE